MIFLAVSVVVWGGVTAALALGLLRRKAPRARPLDLDPGAERRRGAVVAALALATGMIVLALSIFSYAAQRTVFAKDAPAVVVEVIGHRWWWEVRYESDKLDQRFTTANEIHVPVGQFVLANVETADVIHSFWPPSLNGKIDLINNQQSGIGFTAEREGVYRGQCAEFCGEQHAHMGFEIVAESPANFERWRAGQLAEARTLDEGPAVFQRKGCAICHTIRGTLAAGRDGPDLTHVGGRRTIAAAALPRNVGNLAAWIADPQHFKPGAEMPSMPLTGAELTTLATYLDALK
jgi:cytochrome c oxidase subunit 2